MSSLAEVFTYVEQHGIDLHVEGQQLILDGPKGSISPKLAEKAKQHKQEIIKKLSERWNPELASEGYQWCFDCVHWNGKCTTYENPYHAVEKCPQAPRKCQWYELKAKSN